MSLAPPSTSLPTNDDTLDITVRFSASLPDLLLSLPLSGHTTTSTLKQRIRAGLPTDYAQRRLRLIHAGKALLDDALLSTSLKRPVSRPPSRTSTPAPYDTHDPTGSGEGKGKTPVRHPPLSTRIYVHCSIGDITLSDADLATEASLANPSSTSAPQNAAHPIEDDGNDNTVPAPRGFDRLLTAGFTPAEVSSLRIQFFSIQAHTHTPDTMPQGDELRDMEDRWLDNTSTNTTGLDGVESGTGGFGGDDENTQGALDDMIYGTAIGFFWPVGCLVWAAREEGIWSTRRKMAVVVGVVLNVALGLVRFTG